MTTALRHRVTAVALVVTLLVAALAGQAGTDAAGPTRVSGVSPASAVGRAGFAYLTGLRTFAAAVLWNRLDPQYHEYYSTRAYKDLLFLVPNMRLVVLLDPQFVQAYYEVPWLLADNGRVDEALEVAAEGVRNNPRSGLLVTAYAQMLFLKTDDIEAAVRQADRALMRDIRWGSVAERWESLRVLEDIYLRAGRTEKAAKVTVALDALADRYGADKLPGGAHSGQHDHDGDGEQDH